jgi:hypothetical protein
MSQAHPELPKEELDKLTGYKHKVQGKMGEFITLYFFLRSIDD